MKKLAIIMSIVCCLCLLVGCSNKKAESEEEKGWSETQEDGSRTFELTRQGVSSRIISIDETESTQAQKLVYNMSGGENCYYSLSEGDKLYVSILKDGADKECATHKIKLEGNTLHVAVTNDEAQSVRLATVHSYILIEITIPEGENIQALVCTYNGEELTKGV